MKGILFNYIKRILKTLLIGFVSAAVVLIVMFIIRLDSRPDLKIWHKAELDAEFTAESALKTFDEYLTLEKRLFAQLEQKVYDCIQPEDRRLINRYHKNSLSDPDRWTPNWNRSFELSADNPRAGVLLLHGMSDSPYSLRNLGQSLNARGAWIVGLRLPGHGTAPSGLVDVEWVDMAAAVQLAVRHLSEKIGNKPLYIVGYSNGGALAVHYTLLSLEDFTLPQVKGIVLISPAIGVSRLAAMAVWQARIGHLIGLDKLAWNSILPEYDPFKYQSFAVNAGDQVYRLTANIRMHIGKLRAAGNLQRFPPVLAFQSLADATVSTKAVIDGLLARLPKGEHALVLFDINRTSEAKQLLIKDPGTGMQAAFSSPNLSFSISLVTSQSEKKSKVVVRQKGQGESNSILTPLDLNWPDGLYSLSHVALPFSPDDPLYGGPDAGESPGINLGNIALRGERGVLQIPDADMLRLKWNPFYPYMEQRIIEFLNFKGDISQAKTMP